MAIRILRGAQPPWGDYGHILLHGMTGHLARVEGLLQLERTGPYVPPITFPGVGDVVVTSAFRSQLEAAAFRDVAFRPVRKAKVVELAWESWDRAADLPMQMPESGEPEDFVLAAPHSPLAAEALGDLWEVVLPVVADVERVRTGSKLFDTRIVVLLARWSGQQLFRADGVQYNYASDAAQEWLLQRASDHVSFEDCESR